MFYGCTSLTTAPALPATVLDTHCYFKMFYGCTSLTTAPALPAINLKISCYESMFHGCTRLTAVPSLPATVLVGYCYGYMFENCSSLAAYESSASPYTNSWRIPVEGELTRDNCDMYKMLYGTVGSYSSSEYPGGKEATSVEIWVEKAPIM